MIEQLRPDLLPREISVRADRPQTKFRLLRQARARVAVCVRLCMCVCVCHGARVALHRRPLHSLLTP